MRGEIEYEGDKVNNSRQEIYYVQGRNLDSKGTAESWIFGTHSPDGNELQIYDRSGWTTISWNASLPAEAIQFERVMLPEELINQSRSEIGETSVSNGIRVIQLQNGIYSLSIKEGSTNRILEFNATTGALIA